MSYSKKISFICLFIIIINFLSAIPLFILISLLADNEIISTISIIFIFIGNLGIILFSLLAISFGSMADSLIDANENLKNINSNINKLNETKSNNQTTIVLKENKTKGWGTAEVE